MSIKRALVCAPRMPEFDRESGSRRIFHLIEFLREAGWAVSFIAQNQTDGERYARILQQRGVETFVGFGSQTDQLIASSRFDLAIFAFWHMAEKHIPTVRRLSPTTRVIVDMIDLHFLRDARRILHRPADDRPAELLDLKYASDMIGEVNTYAMADGVMAVSQKEADLVNDLIGDPRLASTVPDSEDLPASTVPFDKRNGILFIGNFWHHPNLSAAEYLCKDILPRLDPALMAEHSVYIVGNALNDSVRDYGRNLPNVRMVGWVPSVLPYLNQARVSVIPLLHGAGTKRKLLQALMVGTPTVATSIGAEGLAVKNGEHLLIADDADSFARSIGRLLEDAKLWRLLSREGRKQIVTLHGRENARARLMEVISTVLAREPKPLILDDVIREPDRQTPQRLYKNIVPRIQEIVRAALPPEATVIVVSKGDEELLKLDGRRAWHFPQRDDGVYAGYYPASSAEAISHLEMLRSKGADYLLFPSAALWWLDHYVEFKQYLESRYREIVRQEDACLVFALREPATENQFAANVGSSNGKTTASVDSLPENGCTVISQQLIEKLRPTIPDMPIGSKSNGRGRRKRVLVLGAYLANKSNNVEDVVSVISKSSRYMVTQRWIALGGEPPTKQVADVTVGTVLREKSKFQIMNELLAKEKLSQYEYVLLTDDDIVLPDGFLDHFISLQAQFGFSIAQPARTSNSHIDHPIVEQQKGVLARQTLFVEIGPVVSFHKSAYELVFPFDLTSPMGWGYENVWAYRLVQRQMKMGIIDAVPVDHSLRKPVAYYDWDEADRQRTEFLEQHDHLPLEQCFRVLDVINVGRANNGDGSAIAAH